MTDDLKDYFSSTTKNWNRKTMDRYSSVSYSKKEGSILIPNEIFKDFTSSIEHIRIRPFAYSFYYLITYLYQYSKYGLCINLNRDFLLEYLQYSSNASNKPISKLIKQGGVLDSIDYTMSTTNYPIHTELEDNCLSFTYIKDFKKESGLATKLNTGSLTAKVPLKSLHRTRKSRLNRIFDGTFYETENTHSINIKTFINIIDDEELGVNGFYIYGGLKYLSCGNNSVSESYDKIHSVLDVSSEFIGKYTKALEEKGFLNIYRSNKEGTYYKNKNVYAFL